MPQSEIKMKMSLDGSGVTKALGRAKAGVANFANASMQKLQALGKYVGIGLAAAFLGFSRKAINLGSELSDIAISTGFATEQFQVFRGALIDAGGKAESMEKAVTIMQKAIVQGSEGLTTYIRAFKRLGLNVDKLRAMKPEEQFKTIGKSIASAKDQQGALTAAIEIFGQRNAPRLIEVFKRLDKDGYGKMAKDIEAAYGIMDAETQKALDKAADTIERFKNKATIRVGELISGEGDFAAVKILGFKLMEQAAKFGGKMLSGLGQSIQFLRAGFRASAEWLTSKLTSSFKMITAQFQIGIIKAINAVIEKMNKIPGIEIETKGTENAFDKLNEGLKESERTWTSFFDNFVASQKAFKFDTTYAEDYWSKLAEDQKKILEASKESAKENTKGATVASSFLIEAADKVSKTIEDSKGADISDAEIVDADPDKVTSDQLKEALSRTREKGAELRSQGRFSEATELRASEFKQRTNIRDVRSMERIERITGKDNSDSATFQQMKESLKTIEQELSR